MPCGVNGFLCVCVLHMFLCVCVCVVSVYEPFLTELLNFEWNFFLSAQKGIKFQGLWSEEFELLN